MVEVAVEVFAAHGYDGATTRVLAERAGVNLPAIQYYFGGKEGLYRAAIDHIIAHIETRMAPVCARIKAALARNHATRDELFALLMELLDAFVELVTEEGETESHRLFFARAEVETPGPLDELHECARRQIVEPCAALVARLDDRSSSREDTLLQTLTLLGQVTVFCNRGARRTLGWPDMGNRRAKAIKSVVRRHTEAIFHPARRTGPRRAKGRARGAAAGSRGKGRR